MSIIKTVPAAAVALLAASFTASGQAADRELAGCYKPISGFATSACTDGESCATQTGVYKIVLKNEQATYGQRVLVLSGTFDGRITAVPNHCGGVNAEHVLTDRDRVSTISTGPDVACFDGGGDFVNKVEIVETLTVKEGTGEYVQLIPGGTVTLTGKLGLKTGINKFKVTPLPGDELCFYGRD
jgi:hypothetical protein